MSSHNKKFYFLKKEKIIGFLDKNPSIRRVVIRLYHTLFPENKLSYWILKLDQEKPLTVVQIGSNDGVTWDPIFKIAIKRKNWNLLLVEPIPYLFAKLKENYPKEPRFTFENAAINDGTTQPFYFIREGALVHERIDTDWYKQIGSFRKEHLKKHFDINIEKYIEELEVKGLTLEQLFIRNNIEKLDFLHIDAEGYDWKILSQLDLEKFTPHLILFERKHLSVQEIEDTKKHLNKYKIFEFTADYLCILETKLTNGDLKKLKKRLIN